MRPVLRLCASGARIGEEAASEEWGLSGVPAPSVQ